MPNHKSKVEAGMLFGDLALTGTAEMRSEHQYAEAQCKCGGVKWVRLSHLKAGQVQSCGCRQDKARRDKRTHGLSSHPLYNVHKSMLYRCYDPRSKSYADYGGRGIEVYPEWQFDVSAFVQWAESTGYEAGKQIDRIDNNAGYGPDNCRWVSCLSNQRNRRTNRTVGAFGEMKCVSAWVEDPRCVVSMTTLIRRLNLGWQPERALSKQRRGTENDRSCD